MSIERKALLAICQRLLDGGSNTSYVWLEDRDNQYEVEVIVCRVRDKRNNTQATYCKPTGDYLPASVVLH
jgi:hypothetical protein